jgi:DNA-binding NarL/FixJ family response regulator
MISVAVCDDHALIRYGIQRILEGTTEFELVAASATAEALMAALPDLRPDLLVLDIRLTDGSGLDLLERIAATVPGTRVVMLTMYGAKGYIETARLRGARGYITKECLDEELVSVLRAVMDDEGFVSLRTEEPVASSSERRRPEIDLLSARELEVMKLIAAGLTTAEVAAKLAVSPRTAESHRASIQRKLQIRTRAELARIALDEGLLD